MVVLFTMAEEGSSRFAQVSNEEVENCLCDSVPSNTRKTTALWLKALSDYPFKRQIKFDLKTCSEEELASVLVRLCAEVRTKNGEEYQRSSLLAMRAALQRHISSTLERTDVNIISRGKFTRANNVLDALLKEKPVVQHKPGINSDDMDKLSAYFKNVEGDCDPVRLSQ